jgi:1-deoxy-D-xylulose-5-phosphate synthase
MYALARLGLFDRGLKFRPLTLPDFFIDHDKPATQVAIAGLDAPHIVSAVLTTLGHEEVGTEVQNPRGFHHKRWGASRDGQITARR